MERVLEPADLERVTMVVPDVGASYCSGFCLVDELIAAIIVSATAAVDGLFSTITLPIPSPGGHAVCFLAKNMLIRQCLI